MIDLYFAASSPPCRAVRMTAKLLGIQLNLIDVDMWKGEHMKPQFLKMNPTHTVPVILDNGHCIWESRAILMYLVNKYVPDSPLYPKDSNLRSVVDNMLLFDVSKYYAAFSQYMYPQIFENKPADPEKEKTYKEALEYLERFLCKSSYVAGDTFTLADISIFAEITMSEVLDYDYSAYPYIRRWVNRIKEELGSTHKEINEKPLKELKEHVRKGKK